MAPNHPLVVVSANRWNPNSNCGNCTEFLLLFSRIGSSTLVGHKWEVWLLLHKGSYCETFFSRISNHNFLSRDKKGKLFGINCKTWYTLLYLRNLVIFTSLSKNANKVCWFPFWWTVRCYHTWSVTLFLRKGWEKLGGKKTSSQLL